MSTTEVSAAATGTGPAPVRLSYSRVDSYRTCPLKFRYGYVDGIPQLPSPDLSFGSSVHAALEAWWKQKLPQPPAVDVLLKGLYDGWQPDGFAAMERDEQLRWYRHAQDVVRRHHQRFAADYVPAVACEAYFELDLGSGVEVVGVIDHVARTPSGGLGIVDWKTNRRARTRADVRGSLQLAIYAMAAVELWGHDPEWVALDFVVPGVRVTVAREDIDVEAARDTILATAELVRAEAFAPTPNRLCGWCDYRALCPAFEGDGPDVAGHAVVELQRLQRRRSRDDARIAQLEAVVRDRLGDGAVLELDAGR